MLTADLVRARRRKGELVLVSLDGEDRDEALHLAGLYTDLVREAVGRPRAELDEALGQVEAPPALQRVADGLRKLLEDRCDFEPTLDLPPDELRREVFRRAAARRRELGPGEAFDRGALLAELAAARNVAPDDLERGLYADLRGAHVLRSFEPLTPEALVAAYEGAQAQAVLLRAVRVRADVRCGAAWGYRQLFAKLKFLRLLHAIEPLEGGGYRVDIDGPFSLFESVTKYGLQLALALPAVQACASWSVEADVRWGKAREALVFRLAGRGADARLEGDPLALPPEVEAFRQGFEGLKSPWRVSPSPAILNLPGVGLCVPDLVFERPKGPRVYFEVLGYWSREAVWRRVDMVRKGLGEPLLVAVSERLRVSEDVLDDDPSGALYVYKGALSPRVVLKRLDARWGSGAAGETLPLPVALAPPPAAEAPAKASPGVVVAKAAGAKARAKAKAPSPKAPGEKVFANLSGEKAPANLSRDKLSANPAGETVSSNPAGEGNASGNPAGETASANPTSVKPTAKVKREKAPKAEREGASNGAATGAAPASAEGRRAKARAGASAATRGEPRTEGPGGAVKVESVGAKAPGKGASPKAVAGRTRANAAADKASPRAGGEAIDEEAGTNVQVTR